MATRNSTTRTAAAASVANLFHRPAAVVTLDGAIGALTLAKDAVLQEAGDNETLSHAFSSMTLIIEQLDALRDAIANEGVAHG